MNSGTIVSYVVQNSREEKEMNSGPTSPTEDGSEVISLVVFVTWLRSFQLLNDLVIGFLKSGDVDRALWVLGVVQGMG